MRVLDKPGRMQRRIWGMLHLHIKYQLMIPAIVILGAVIAFPLLYSLYISFHEYLMITGLGDFIGLANYGQAFLDQELLVSLLNTFKYTAAAVGLELLIAFGLALLLNRRNLRFRNVYMVILMIPVLITPVAVGLIWKLILHPRLGIANYLLGWLRIPPQGWFGDRHLAMPALVAVDVWHETSLILLILLAGLTNLPVEPLEAATVDGASSVKRFWHITLPLLKPVILVAVLIRLISCLKIYDLVYVCTRGGPGSRTQTMSYFVYRIAFRTLHMGQAAAVSYLLLGIILIFSLVFIKVLGREA